jgi:hypothetical protein
MLIKRDSPLLAAGYPEGPFSFASPNCFGFAFNDVSIRLLRAQTSSSHRTFLNDKRFFEGKNEILFKVVRSSVFETAKKDG